MQLVKGGKSMGEHDKLANMMTEIEKRIEVMEDPAYDPGPRLNRQDFIGIIVVAIICLIGMIWGY
jgi:hypothetical protein